MKTSSPDIWVLSFRAEGRADVPTVVRVRRLLKAALRAYGLRCVDFRVASNASKPEAAGPDIDTPAPVNAPECEPLPKPNQLNVSLGETVSPKLSYLVGHSVRQGKLNVSLPDTVSNKLTLPKDNRGETAKAAGVGSADFQFGRKGSDKSKARASESPAFTERIGNTGTDDISVAGKVRKS